MKVAVLVAAAALAVGTGAIAQTQSAPQGDSIGKKAGRVFDRMEDATARGIDKVRGGAGHAKKEAKQETHEARVESRKDDTRAMGAGRADTTARPDQPMPQDRQARMDDAYTNWKSQQQR